MSHPPQADPATCPHPGWHLMGNLWTCDACDYQDEENPEHV